MPNGTELGTGYVSLTVEAEGIEADMRRKVGDPAEREADRAGKAGGEKFSAGFGGGLKKLAAIAGPALAAVGVGAFAASAVRAGSDLNEVISKSGAVFGTAAGEIEAWASGAAKGFGQSKTAALGAASQFGNMFKQLGIGGPQVANLSKGMTELASDFASFHNADITEVLEAQQAAFRGEYDSIQRFLPTLSAAAVQQKALAMTGKATTEELTEQDKALATHALMLEGAGDALGDFDRTSSGAANQQRILAARFADIRAELGQKLLPALTSVAGFVLDKVLPAFEAFGKGVVNTFTTIANVVRTGGTEDELRSGWVGVLERIGLAALALKNWWVANWPQIQSVAAVVFDAVRSAVESLMPVITRLWELLQQLWPAIQIVAVVLGGIALGAIIAVSIQVQIMAAIWQALTSAVLVLVSVFRDVLWPILTVVASFFAGAFTVAVNTAMSAVRAFWGVLQTLASVAGQVAGFIHDRFNDIAGFITSIPGRVSGALRTVFGPLIDAGSEIWQFIAGTVNNVVDFIRGMPSRVAGVFGGMFDGLKNAFRSAVNFIIGGWNRLQFTIPSIDIPLVGTFGGQTIGLPDIPFLAAGGLATRATPAIVGEASTRANPEVIAPLSELRRYLEPPASSGDTIVYARTDADPHEIARAIAFQRKVSGR